MLCGIPLLVAWFSSPFPWRPFRVSFSTWEGNFLSMTGNGASFSIGPNERESPSVYPAAIPFKPVLSNLDRQESGSCPSETPGSAPSVLPTPKRPRMSRTCKTTHSSSAGRGDSSRPGGRLPFPSRRGLSPTARWIPPRPRVDFPHVGGLPTALPFVASHLRHCNANFDCSHPSLRALLPARRPQVDCIASDAMVDSSLALWCVKTRWRPGEVEVLRVDEDGAGERNKHVRLDGNRLTCRRLGIEHGTANPSRAGEANSPSPKGTRRSTGGRWNEIEAEVR